MQESVEINLVALVKSIVTVIMPPIGVFLHVGLTLHLLLNVVLTLLGYFPGLVHAIYIYLTRNGKHSIG